MTRKAEQGAVCSNLTQRKAFDKPLLPLKTLSSSFALVSSGVKHEDLKANRKDMVISIPHLTIIPSNY